MLQFLANAFRNQTSRLARRQSGLQGKERKIPRINFARTHARPSVEQLEDRIALSFYTWLRGLTVPSGVTTDYNSNVFVNYVGGLSNCVVGKWSPQGAYQGSVTVEQSLSCSPGHLITVAFGTSGLLLNLTPAGRIYTIDPDQGQPALFLDVAQLPFIDTTSIYDIQSGQFSGFGGSIIPQRASYGDIAAFGNDLFLSGISNGLSFVMRVRFDTGVAAKVVVASQATQPGNTIARGVAVNSQGTVATTLPYSPTGRLEQGVDVPISFSDSFPEDGSQPSGVLVDLTSRGITIDANDNFWIATGPIQSSLCIPQNAVIGLSADFTHYGCIDLRDSGLVYSQQVAFSPDQQYLYVSVTNVGEIWRVPFGSGPAGPAGSMDDHWTGTLGGPSNPAAKGRPEEILFAHLVREAAGEEATPATPRVSPLPTPAPDTCLPPVPAAVDPIFAGGTEEHGRLFLSSAKPDVLILRHRMGDSVWREVLGTW